MTVKLRLPPGFSDNGTEYMAAGRWHTGNLVRWRDAVLRPIGGWQRLYNSLTNVPVDPLWATAGEVVRGGIALHVAASGETNVFLGSNRKIYRLTNSNDVSDVTPPTFTEQETDADISTGYGDIAYGTASYGVERPAGQGSPDAAFSWGFSDWGFWPIAVARSKSFPIFIRRDTDTTFTPIVNSPVGCNDAVVTDERMVMAVGTPDDDRLIQWSDQEDFDTWAPAATNSAGFIRVAGVGKLLRAIKVQSDILIIGETDAFRATYIGPPYIYGVYRVGDKCRLVGPNAVTTTSSFAVWMGEAAFWIYDGSVKPLPCEVFGYIKRDINRSQQSKTVAFTNALHGEIWWLYQSNDSDEVDSYVVFNYMLQCWYYGKLNRTFGLDAGALFRPMLVDRNGYLYAHEMENSNYLDADGSVGERWVQSGALEMENGQRLFGCAYVYPDVEPSNTSLTMTLSVRDFPTEPIRYSRDFELQNPVSTMGIMGREILMRLQASGDPDADRQWRVGDMRIEPVKIAGPQR